MEIEITHFSHESPLYQECLKIRCEILRKPLGMQVLDSDREKDAKSIHILCKYKGKPAGTVALMDNTLRQMAVLDEFQGLALGRKLVAYLEKLAKEQGYDEVELAARMVALDFYKKCGYTAYGDEYMHIAVPHVDMKKAI